MRRLAHWIGTVLFAAGVIVLLVVGGIYAYGLYEDSEYQSAVADVTAVAALQPALALTPVPSTLIASPTRVALASSTPEPVVTPTSPGPPEATKVPLAATSVPPAVPTTTPSDQMDATPGIMVDNPQVATRIKAPAIKLDAPVAESVISNGQWLVPKFAAGHLQGTAKPGGPGNAVFAGHVSSISSGNVFSNIGKLSPGDDVVFVTAAGDLHYEVSEKKVVKNTDLSVTKDFGDQRATLITCTGRWLFLQHDFNERMVVVAIRVG